MKVLFKERDLLLFSYKSSSYLHLKLKVTKYIIIYYITTYYIITHYIKSIA
jgi:hypothetical protein